MTVTLPARPSRHTRPPDQAASAAPPRCPAASAARTIPSAPATPATSASAPSRSRTTIGSADPRRDRGRPRSIWRYRAAAPRAPDVAAAPGLAPGCTRLRPRRQPRRARSACARCGSRTTAATRRTRSRTASSPSRCPRRGPSAWTRSPARRPATWPNAVAAAAARAGLRSVVVIPSRPRGRQDHHDRGLRRHAGRGRGHLRRRQPALLRGRRRGVRATWGFVNVNLRPYYAEGSKTVGYEIAEQLGWRLPEQVVSPIASGSLLTKVDKAFRELGVARPGRGHALPRLRRAGDRLLAGVAGLRGRPRRRTPGRAGHHRQVAGHRQPRRRAVRAGRLPPHRRRDRGRHRRRGRRGHPAARARPRASSPRPPAA